MGTIVLLARRGVKSVFFFLFLVSSLHDTCSFSFFYLLIWVDLGLTRLDGVPIPPLAPHYYYYYSPVFPVCCFVDLLFLLWSDIPRNPVCWPAGKNKPLFQHGAGIQTDTPIDSNSGVTVSPCLHHDLALKLEEEAWQPNSYNPARSSCLLYDRHILHHSTCFGVIDIFMLTFLHRWTG